MSKHMQGFNAAPAIRPLAPAVARYIANTLPHELERYERAERIITGYGLDRAALLCHLFEFSGMTPGQPDPQPLELG